MKTFKPLAVLLATLLTCGAAAGATACGDEKKQVNAGGDLSIYIWNEDGTTPEGFDDVLTYFNDTYSSELGFKVKFKFDTQSDYKQNLNLAMAAGQNSYDLVFDAG